MNNSWHIIQQGAVIVIVGQKGQGGKGRKEERVFGNAVQKLMLMSGRIFGVQPVFVSVFVSISLRSCSILSALVHLEV